MTAHRRAHRDVLFGSKLSTVHESEMARIYGFTERIRAILPRHVHTPPQIALFIPTCVTFELILNVALLLPVADYHLATIFLKVSPRGLLLRRHCLVAYLQLFITSFFHTSREHDTGILYVRVRVYVWCIIYSANDVTFSVKHYSRDSSITW